MIILVLNCGSSSIKYQVLDLRCNKHELLAKGLVERIGMAEGDLTHKPAGKTPFEQHLPIADHTTGIRLVLDALTDPEHGVIGSLDELSAVGHRVAHGGEYFADSCIVDQEVKRRIEELFAIAPLHNPANMQGILSIGSVLPGIPQVAVFDTSFHHTIPAVNYMYAIPYEYYERYRVRKYGFHGTSHKYVAAKGAELAGLDLASSRIITCHIGNGASVTAVENGRSVDTSMGFSPLDGLMMGTRSGSIDVSAATYIASHEGMDYEQLDQMLNKRSGVLGVSGISSGIRPRRGARRTRTRHVQRQNQEVCRRVCGRDGRRRSDSLYRRRRGKFEGAARGGMLRVGVHGCRVRRGGQPLGRTRQGRHTVEGLVADEGRRRMHRRGAHDSRRHLSSGQRIVETH